jgi:hypothetical protein
MKSKRIAKVSMQVSLIVTLGVLLASCNNAPTASPVACVLRMQAQVSIQNSVGVSQTVNVGGVSTSGRWLSSMGSSTCSGTALTFNGTTAYGTGLQDNTGVQMNASWQVAWSYQNTPVSACGNYSNQGAVPDSGAVFNVVCSL